MRHLQTLAPALILGFALGVSMPVAAGNCIASVVPGDVIQPVNSVGTSDPISYVGLVRITMEDGTVVTVAGVGGDSPCDFWDGFNPGFGACEENGEPVPLFAAEQNDVTMGTLNHARVLVDYDCNGVPDYNLPAVTVVIPPPL